MNYTYSTTHKHAVTTLSNGNTYGYDSNGNMTSRNVNGQSFTLAYDAENRLVSVSGAATASFSYDADGKQVIGTVNGVTTYYVGNHYEVKSGVVTKYYTSTPLSAGFAGATRLAVRTGDTLSFLLADHLGSSSVTTDANGAPTASALYKAFGETRYSLGNLNTDYKFTGQRDEPSLGIYFFQSRWFDSTLGRFTQPDSIVPTGTQGTQAWDRYAFVNNNPVRYNDPTGHKACDEVDADGNCFGEDEISITNWAKVADGLNSEAEKIRDDLGRDVIQTAITAGITTASAWAAHGVVSCSAVGQAGATACAIAGGVMGFFAGIYISNLVADQVEYEATMYEAATSVILNNLSDKGELDMTVTHTPSITIGVDSPFLVSGLSKISLPERYTIVGGNGQTATLSPSQMTFFNTLIATMNGH